MAKPFTANAVDATSQRPAVDAGGFEGCHAHTGQSISPIGLVALATVFANCFVQPALAADVWLSAIDPVVQKEQKHNDIPKEYMDLFRLNSPWPKAASGLGAFKISTQFGLRSTDDQLRTLIADLRHRIVSDAAMIALHC